MALIEGMSPLARIALTARTARRAFRLVTCQVPSARQLLEAALSAAERAASGQPLSPEEDLAARDEAVLQACHLEESHGSKTAAAVQYVIRPTARCVYDPEFTYGENFFMVEIGIQIVINSLLDHGNVGESTQVSVGDAPRAVKEDRERLILYADETGEPWRDPRLERSVAEERDWNRMLTAAGIPIPFHPESPGDIRDRWQRIHQAVRQSGGRFYPPTLFGQF